MHTYAKTDLTSGNQRALITCSIQWYEKLLFIDR